MALTFRALVLAGALAGTTMIAAPAAAAPLPALGAPSAAIGHSRFDPLAANADWGCRWGCGWGRGWGRGWGGGWGRRGWRRNRIDGGDVLIGAAIIGGAIAIANSNNRRRERDRDVVIVDREVRNTDWRYDDRRFEDRRASPRGTGASGLDNAVNQCLDRIERDVRVDSVDDVSRTGAGWRVNGVLFNGAPFECRIGNSGQIDAIDYGDGFRSSGLAPAPAPADGQWDADRYAGARAALGGTVRPDMAVQEARIEPGAAPVRVAAAPATALPAYPGGPIPGEVIPEEAPLPIDGDL